MQEEGNHGIENTMFSMQCSKTHVQVNAEFSQKLLLHQQKYEKFYMFTIFIHVISKEKEIFHRPITSAVYNFWNGCNRGYMFCPSLCSQMNLTLLSNGIKNARTFQF